MSEADGLKRLTEFLNQTRKQAEVAVDCLNVRISELEHDREKFLGERDYYKNYAEQLRIENSKKWRLQERDDWKALVDSVQKDRSRLQDECHKLEEELTSAYEELNRMEDEHERLQQDDDSKCKGDHNEPQVNTAEEPLLLEQHHQHPSDHMLEFEDASEAEGAQHIPEEEEENEVILEPVSTPRKQCCSNSPTSTVLLTPSSSTDDGAVDLSVRQPDSAERDEEHVGTCQSSPVALSRSHSIDSTGPRSPRGTPLPAGGSNRHLHSPRCHSKSPTASVNLSRRLSIGTCVLGDLDPASSAPVDGSPRAMVRELRKELAKAHAEISILRKTSETESVAQEQEICRLREEVKLLQARNHGIVTDALSPSSEEAEGNSAGRSRHFSHDESAFLPAIPPPPPHKREAGSSSGSMSALWSNPLSVLGYFFSYSSTSSAAVSNHPHTSAQYV